MQKAVIIAGILLPLASFSQKRFSINTFTVSNKVAGIIAGMKIQSASAAAIVTTTTNGIGSCTPAPCTTLPVQLLSFDGTRLNDNQVKLYWQTTNEIQNKGFDVERSLGNITGFIQVGFVASKRSSSAKQKYELTDPNDFEGISYYRLKQIDLNAGYVYSNVIAVKGYSQKEKLKVYPNPVASKLALNIDINKTSSASLVITDAAGRILTKYSYLLNAGTNTKQLDVALLKKGVYLLKLVRPGEKELSTMFVKD